MEVILIIIVLVVLLNLLSSYCNFFLLSDRFTHGDVGENGG